MPASSNERDLKAAESRVLELEREIAALKSEMARQKAYFGDAMLRANILSRLALSKGQLLAGLEKKRRRGRPAQAAGQLEEQLSLVLQSDIFDPDWYLAFYPDVARMDSNPARHFVLEGAYELRHPGPGFDSFAYHKAHPDVTAEGIPAFIHYLRNGRSEQRQTSPVGECGEAHWKDLA